MRIEGAAGGVLTSTVVLARPSGDLKLTLAALPLGYEEELDKLLPVPRPPFKGPMRDEQGKMLREGNRVVPFYDEQEVGYVAARALASRRRMTLMLKQALSADPSVTWETHRDQCGSEADYADRLYAELREFGFSQGDLVRLIKAVVETSTLTEEELSEGREGFFRPGVGSTAG
jgi:hypothetical protein